MSVQAEHKEALLWLGTILWHMLNPDRAGEQENIADAFRFLYRCDPTAARDISSRLADHYDLAASTRKDPS